MRVPVVERVVPELAGRRSSRPAARPRRRRRGRAPGRRGGRRCRARRRSGRRRAAETSFLRAYARSAVHSRSKRTWSASAPSPAKRGPVAGPERMPRDEAPRASASVTSRVRVARAGRASRRRRRRSGTASRARPAGRAAGSATTTGRPRASQSTKRYASSPRRPPGSEVGCSRTPLERFASRTGGYCRDRVETPGAMPTKPTAKTPPPRIRITNVKPLVDCGRHPAKRSVGDRVEVRATVFRDGHEILGAQVLLPRAGRRSAGRTAPLEPLWQRPLRRLVRGRRELGRWEFRVEAWSRPRRDLARRAAPQGRGRGGGPRRASSPRARRCSASQSLDVETGARLDRRRPARHACARPPLEVEVDRVLGALRRLVRALPALVRRVRGRREGAARSSPSSASTSSTSRRSTRSARRGRKGRNNTLPREAGRPRQPVGDRRARRAATTRSIPSSARSTTSTGSSRARTKLGLEIALDFAIQCSPDHPWLKEHPEWFQHRPDGTIKYAENPPKKYQDIVNVELGVRGLARASGRRCATSSCSGSSHGVRVFRVDNPHTKPLPFWEWLIAEVRARRPGRRSSSPRRSRGRR